jgi:phosphoribosyl-AMP cyclohydrolase
MKVDMLLVYICHVYSIPSRQLIKPQVIHLMSDVSRHVTGVYISCVQYPVWTTGKTTGHTLVSDVSRHVTGEYISCSQYPVWKTDNTTGHTLDVRCK